MLDVDLMERRCGLCLAAEELSISDTILQTQHDKLLEPRLMNTDYGSILSEVLVLRVGIRNALLTLKVPGFNRSDVNTAIYQKTFPEVKGLAKLLLLEERDLQHRSLQLSNGRLFWFYDSGNFDDCAEKVNSLETLSVVDEDVVCHVIDYNNGVLLPFTEITTPHKIFNRLTYRATAGVSPDTLDERLKNPSAQEKTWSSSTEANTSVKHLYYVFGWSLEQIEDAEEYFIVKKLKKENKPYQLHVPRYTEFIGSLQEYMDSLPPVEDDWYSEAISKFKAPTLHLEV